MSRLGRATPAVALRCQHATLSGIVPDTTGIGLLEFHQIDHAREAGRQAGEAAVAALRQGRFLAVGATAPRPIEFEGTAL